MKNKKCFNALFVARFIASKILIEDFKFKCSNRISPSYFTRSGKTGFKETTPFMLNMINKSVQVELNKFFEGFLKTEKPISKQAFSENRQKIHPKVFIDLNNRINEIIYSKCSEDELWNGYELSAIDRTTIELPNTELLRNEFGYAKNQHTKVAVARASASCIFDVINKLVIKSKIYNFKACERKAAMELILQI